MDVTMIDYTGFGNHDPARHAANVLVFTKSTRLTMRPGLMEDIASRDWDWIMKELGYMAKTIPSSWEFCHYTILMTDVTRAFTHQFVRTRQGSYAQQTMRILDVGGWTYGTGPSLTAEGETLDDPGIGPNSRLYHDTMATIAAAYDELVAAGVPIEDARGLLPTNIHTNIVASFNLRTLAELFRKRASSRTQDEYRQVLEAMKTEVIKVHPWTVLFFEQTFDRAAVELEAKVLKQASLGNINQEEKLAMVKLIDQLRGNA